MKKATIQMKPLETYRGATIYQFDEPEAASQKIIQLKLFAKGHMPKPANLIIHFDAEDSNQNNALRKIKSHIDAYLKEHNIKELISEN